MAVRDNTPAGTWLCRDLSNSTRKVRKCRALLGNQAPDDRMWESLVIRSPWKRENAGANPAILTSGGKSMCPDASTLLGSSNGRAAALHAANGSSILSPSTRT
jgi:hypothetical protein